MSGLSAKAGNKATPTDSNFDANAVQAQLDNMHQTMHSMSQHVQTLGQDYQAVIGEMLTFQKNLIAQDQLMQSLIQYLVNLEAGERVKTFIRWCKRLINSFANIRRRRPQSSGVWDLAGFICTLRSVIIRPAAYLDLH